MADTTNLGVYKIPEEGTASYTVPANYSNDQLDKMKIEIVDAKGTNELLDEYDEVTHEVFFGENIKRLKKLFFKK